MKNNLIAIFFLSLLLIAPACADEPDKFGDSSAKFDSDSIMQPIGPESEILDGSWEIVYSYYQDSSIMFNAAETFENWRRIDSITNNKCKSYFYPPFGIPYYKIAPDTYHIVWRERVDSPTVELLEQKKRLFESLFNPNNDLSLNDKIKCTYYKRNPEYAGPWRIVYYEMFQDYEKDAPGFKEWRLNAQASNLNLSFFCLKNKIWYEESLSCDEEIILNYYKNRSGFFRWEEVIETATPEIVQSKVAKFNSFTRIAHGFDFFGAYYVPLNLLQNINTPNTK